MRRNFLKDKLKNGEKVLGTWNTISSPLVTDIIASSGLDFIFIDFEHGPFDIKNVHMYVAACESHNVSPIIRLPSNSPWKMQQALDQGAHGLIVPHIETAEDAKRLTDGVKFFPKGCRGFTPFVKAGSYGGCDSKAYAKVQNDFTLTMALVESVDGINRLDEICQNDELDLVFFGSYDISQSLGVVGDVMHCSVRKEIERGCSIVRKYGKFVGGYLARSNEDIVWLKKLGFDLLVYDVDVSVLRSAYSEASSFFKL